MSNIFIDIIIENNSNIISSSYLSNSIIKNIITSNINTSNIITSNIIYSPSIRKNSSLPFLNRKNSIKKKISFSNLNDIDSPIDNDINYSFPNDTNNDLKININEKIKKINIYIKESKKKINTNLFIIATEYDKNYYRYNSISLLILIISTIVTFTEALKLTILSYIDKNNITNILQYNSISLIFNIISLFLGTFLTILSSIIKFKNYRDIMERLKKNQDILFNFKILYNKQRELIKYFEIFDEYNNDIFDNLFNKIIEYNNEIKELNIFEDIRNSDIIKYNKFKMKHDIELEYLYLKKETELSKINFNNNIKINKINKIKNF